MRRLKRIGIGLAGSLALLLLAALGARAWFVRRLPRLEHEADATWGRAGIPVSELPKRFPETEKNDDARWLEAMAVKLEVPVFSDPVCRSGEGRGAELDINIESITTCAKRRDAAPKFKLADRLKAYVNAELEKSIPVGAPPLPELAEYLNRHRSDIDSLAEELPARSPVWRDRSQWNSDQPDWIMVFALHRIIAADAFSRLAGDPAWDSGPAERAIHGLATALAMRGNTADILIEIAMDRTALSLDRRAAARGKPSPGRAQTNYRDRIVLVTEREDWALRPEVLRKQLPDSGNGFTSRGLKFLNGPLEWLTRPWADASLNDMRRVRAEDALRLREADGCHGLVTKIAADRFVYGKHSVRDPNMKWWNQIGPIVYAIGINSSGEESRVIRIELEQELTEQVRLAAAARDGQGRVPEKIAGFGVSRCGPDRWKLTATSGGGAVIEFVNPPVLGKMKGAQIPLRYELPGPAKR